MTASSSSARPTRLQGQPAYGCSFPEAISRFVRKYVTFSGRAGRAEFWWVALLTGVVGGVLQGLLNGSSSDGDGFLLVTVLAFVWNLAIFLPNLAITWRRLHDTGRSGAWFFVGLIPLVGWIVLLVFLILPPTPSNQYGPGPEHVGAPGAV